MGGGEFGGLRDAAELPPPAGTERRLLWKRYRGQPVSGIALVAGGVCGWPVTG